MGLAPPTGTWGPEGPTLAGRRAGKGPTGVAADASGRPHRAFTTSLVQASSCDAHTSPIQTRGRAPPNRSLQGGRTGLGPACVPTRESHLPHPPRGTGPLSHRPTPVLARAPGRPTGCSLELRPAASVRLLILVQEPGLHASHLMTGRGAGAVPGALFPKDRYGFGVFGFLGGSATENTRLPRQP